MQVNIDIVNFGEDDSNADILNKFIGCHSTCFIIFFFRNFSKNF